MYMELHVCKSGLKEYVKTVYKEDLIRDITNNRRKKKLGRKEMTYESKGLFAKGSEQINHHLAIPRIEYKHHGCIHLCY